MSQSYVFVFFFVKRHDRREEIRESSYRSLPSGTPVFPCLTHPSPYHNLPSFLDSCVLPSLNSQHSTFSFQPSPVPPLSPFPTSPITPSLILSHLLSSPHTDVPVTRLRPGRSLNLSSIEEGDDVYFECSIKANPPVTQISWLHEVSIYWAQEGRGLSVVGY
ncbi:hypothetical protein E2C01_044699 [Portunus trituberculatus]|uniref:Ig-like domain-containing protein n=1 Tax=Portunus trituberculatus TaxID=210409 RepID=A0A5B7FZX2_PORTR|nr:hypothetical protein [Portunus trituberculatus]